MLKYRIALINVFWSEDDINTRFFPSVADQSAYFDALTENNFSDLNNFNMGNNVETRVIYRDTSNRDIDELIKCNYAVIHKVDEDGNILNRRYFFAYPSQDSGRQLSVTLSLDDIQNNYFPYKNKIRPSIIKRACLSRFRHIVTDNKVSFNGTTSSYLFNDENITPPKRLSKRVKCNLYKPTDDPALSEQSTLICNWLNENVYGWVYIYCDKNHAYRLYNSSNIEFTTTLLELKYNINNTTLLTTESIGSGVSCLCYPLLKAGKYIYINNFLLDAESCKYFEDNNEGASYIISKKISVIPPFNIYDIYKGLVFSNNNTISTNGNTLRLNDIERGTRGGFGKFNNIGYYTVNPINTLNSRCLLCVDNHNSWIDCEEIDTGIRYTFTVNELKNQAQSHFLGYEPKLLSQSFSEILIRNNIGEGYSFDLQKLNTPKLNIRYYEALTPDISRYFVTLTGLSGIYIEDIIKNLTGAVGDYDGSLTLSTSQYQSMIANNKNYYMQQTMNNMTGLAGGMIGGATAVGFGMASGNPLAIAGGFSAMAGSIGNTLKNIATQELTIDNMKNAPSSISVGKSAGIMNSAISEYGVFLEYYDCLSADKIKAYYYLLMFGYSYNIFSSSLGSVDNIRKNFNYISCEIDSILAPISNIEKDRLKNRLREVRFWNTDKVQYTVGENYENWLDEA